MYDIRFSNGKKLSGVRIDGSAFASDEKLTRAEIEGGLRVVEIEQTSVSEGDPEGYSGGRYENMSLGYYGEHGGVLEIVLNPCNEVERAKLQLRGDVDYIAMMTGVEL